MTKEERTHEGVDAEARFVSGMRTLRQGRGWSQDRLSQELAEVGLRLNPSSITKIEWLLDPAKRSQARPVRLGEAVTIAQTLGTDLALLIDPDSVGLDPQAALEEARRAHEEALQEEMTLRSALALAQARASVTEEMVRTIASDFLTPKADGDGEHSEKA